MNNLYDILEICLQELENGVSVETLVARYPKYANELRPMLVVSLQARKMAASAPSTEVVRRGRAKLLQRAAEMREAKVAPRRRVIPLFQRLAISLGLVAGLLTTGTGLVSASSTALPGENLYPVKRSWEDLQLAFVFNKQAREALVNHFENERLGEINELLINNRDEQIQFAGVFMQVNGSAYVSGIPVVLPSGAQIPVDGTAVTVIGRTDSQGLVQIESIDLLPAGVIVPLGQPVEIESGAEEGSDSHPDSNSNGGAPSNGGAGSGSGTEAPGNNSNPQIPFATPLPPSSEMKGVVQSVSSETVVVNGQTISLSGVQVNGELRPGVTVEVKGYFDQNSQFIVTEIKVEDQGGSRNDGSSASSNPNFSSGGSDSNSDPSSNSGSDSNVSSGSDSHSGSDSTSISGSSTDSSHQDGGDTTKSGETPDAPSSGGG